MPLTTAPPVSFIPTRDAAAARSFYEHTLGLRFLADEPYALVFSLGPEPGTVLRVVRTGQFEPVAFTVFGWEVDDIVARVDDLTARGVSFERYSFFEHDDRGIWHGENGTRLAWFKDPDGNTLSLSQHRSE